MNSIFSKKAEFIHHGFRLAKKTQNFRLFFVWTSLLYHFVKRNVCFTFIKVYIYMYIYIYNHIIYAYI